MSVEEKSLRETLEANFPKETPAEPAKETTPPAVESPPITEEKKDGPILDGAGDDKPSGMVGSDGKAPDSGKPGSDGKSDTPADKSSVSLDAPVSLKATERAEWAKAPKAIQEAFLRRDAEVQTALRQSAESRKLAEEFNQVVGPYMPLIRASQSTPMVAFKNLMTTAAGLTLGTPQQKAQIIRDIINNYRVDIKTLDEVLSAGMQGGGQAPAGPGTSEVEVHIQKAIAPVYQFMESLTNQQKVAAQRAQSEAERAVEVFKEKNEFFEDLRGDMADMMELAASRGREMTMQQAYDACVSFNPTIKAAIDQKRAAASNGAAQKARLAASSVAGSPAGQRPRDPNANSLRDDLLAAMERAEGK
jgi:hypothetical protein